MKWTNNTTFLFALAWGAGAGLIHAATFSNETPINIPADAPASPYPSTIEVIRMDGGITSLSVTLINIRHPHPDRLHLLLAGPRGEKVMLMSGAGGGNPVAGVTLTFTHGGGVMLPDSDQIVSGTYEPTDYENRSFIPSPAPLGPYDADLSVFNGTDPNGRWQLFVHDDSSSNGGGSIAGGWVLEFGQDPGPVITAQPQSQTVAPGDPVIFEVAARGTAPLNYQWRLNGVLLPETNATLMLREVQATDGGSFRVTVWNEEGAVTSDPAVLAVRAATHPPPSSRFRERPRVNDFAGIMQGNSATAGSEPGEPVFPGGGQSVWFEWIAPANGIATLTSQGSAFDTLLSVFTGTDLSELNFVTGDDDQGGFYTSRLQFNARQGTRYQIALDGFGPEGAGGEFTVSWELEETQDQVPILVSIPQFQSVLPETTAEFSVSTDSPSDTFQWFHNDTLIPGATGSTLTVPNAQSSDLGLYYVRVSNDSGRFIQSPPVPLEISSPPSDFSQMQYQKAQASGNRPAAGFIPIALGGILSKENLAMSPGQAGALCEEFWGPIALGLHAEEDGVILAHTTGSEVAAKLAVYEDAHLGGEFPINCGPPGNPSMMTFTAVKGNNYTVEAVNLLATGNLKLTTELGIAPAIPEAPTFHSLPPNGAIMLHMPATNWVPSPTLQWRLNGQNIPGATDTPLHVTDFSALKAGAYSVVMSNFVRVATKTVAHLELAAPLKLQTELLTENGNLNLVITASNAGTFTLVTATNLDANTQWVPLVTHQDPSLMFRYTNVNLLSEPRRFFRAIPWPPPAP